MDLVYSVTRKYTSTSVKSLQNYECLHEGHTLCCVSSKNIVAFTTKTELDDITGKSWGSHVYVADLNTPWWTHKVVSSRAEVTALEWDLHGDKLLVADLAGSVQLWTLGDHALNDWTCLGTATFAGEHILGAAFFHNGKKVSLVAEKKDSPLYSDKFGQARFLPSARHWGGQATEGCLVVSTTGLVGAVVVCRQATGAPQLLTTTESLANTRGRVTAVDVCHGKNGHFLVAVSSGSASLPVQCFRVSVGQAEDKCSVVSQALPSFFLQPRPSKDSQCRHVVQLKFVVREDADSLVVAANGDAGCRVEIWELREKAVQIHKMFQPKTHPAPAEPFKVVVWQQQSHFSAPSPVVCVTTSKLSLTTATPPPFYVMVALGDGSIHCLYRDLLKQIASTSLNLSWRHEEAGGGKQQRLSPRISHLDMSWLGCVLLAADTLGQLYLYRLLPVAEPVCVVGGPMTVPYACTLLEYCLLTNFDWWDLLVSLRPSMMDTVCERFTESFNRQPPAVQHFYYVQFLNIKTSLYRLTMYGQTKAADLTSLLMLRSVATAFETLLRPSDLSSHDKSPAESLAAVMTESHTDVDKVLLHLEAKEFTVEPSTLQSLQQLIQWVADLAMNLLARLPEQRQCELLRDHKALNTLRELLVIVRVWGLLRQSCLPVFVRSSESLDVLALLFKLLSRLVQSQEPDDNLLDDCCLLPSQVLIPQLRSPCKVVAVASPPLFFLALPVQLQFGVEPDCLGFVPDLSPVEGTMQPDQKIDGIRHIYLGKQPPLYKQCCRCSEKAQVHCTSRLAAVRAWDQRWIRACHCGGLWWIHRFT
ncbi:mediator of RNA polymerase II transcription subunit 16 isoform X2 [Bacillus rossius redtenbacheri]|uniref:mediator of RNA polymerase II transcription subunit 16 isoform X2 n=1 Tax=Bacillus rossius redtenbacheri TaxID=93214 RepID=UPI002FDE4240